MHPATWWSNAWAQLKPDLLEHRLDLILHPSPARVRWLGLFTAIGHPVFGVIWGYWLKQPYENLWLRGFVSLLGLSLMLPSFSNDPSSQRTGRAFSFIFWLQLPFLFTWMYLANGGNTVWLASFCAMLLIYYHVTDWRIATLGTILGLAIGWTMVEHFLPGAPFIDKTTSQVNAVVIGFSWSAALLLGFSSANLRREHLNHTLATMGIMAHELRTPLATISLIGDALRGESAQATSGRQVEKLDMLATRLHALVRQMNHQIDTQIANARLTRLPTATETISAADVARSVVRNYPYRSTRDRERVTVDIRRDFLFDASFQLFSQVVDNLFKNAFRALAAANRPPAAGDLHVEVDVEGSVGRIIVRDRGTGIDPRLQARIFEPFFSTSRSTGHGLGLAFSRRVLATVHGQIAVTSIPGEGAAFTLLIPHIH